MGDFLELLFDGVSVAVDVVTDLLSLWAFGGTDRK
jgi:hypothetical protein